MKCTVCHFSHDELESMKGCKMLGQIVEIFETSYSNIKFKFKSCIKNRPSRGIQMGKRILSSW